METLSCQKMLQFLVFKLVSLNNLPVQFYFCRESEYSQKYQHLPAAEWSPGHVGEANFSFPRGMFWIWILSHQPEVRQQAGNCSSSIQDYPAIPGFYSWNLPSSFPQCLLYLQQTIPKEPGEAGQNWIYSVGASGGFRTVFYHGENAALRVWRKSGKMRCFFRDFPWNIGVLGEAAPTKTKLLPPKQIKPIKR